METKNNAIGKKIVGSIIAGVFAVALLLSAPKAKAYASDWQDYNSHDYDNHYNNNYNNGYGGGFTFLAIPSVDYMKSAFMQNFNYQNDVNFANHTAVNYGATAATENYAQGYNLAGHTYNNDFGGASFGVNALFMWLTGLLGGGHEGSMFSHMY